MRQSKRLPRPQARSADLPLRRQVQGPPVRHHPAILLPLRPRRLPFELLRPHPQAMGDGQRTDVGLMGPRVQDIHTRRLPHIRPPPGSLRHSPPGHPSRRPPNRRIHTVPRRARPSRRSRRSSPGLGLVPPATSTSSPAGTSTAQSRSGTSAARAAPSASSARRTAWGPRGGSIIRTSVRAHQGPMG